MGRQLRAEAKAFTPRTKRYGYETLLSGQAQIVEGILLSVGGKNDDRNVSDRKCSSFLTTNSPARFSYSKHRATLNVCLTVNGYDPTASFMRAKKKYGSMTVFHGTKVDYVPSILESGLQNRVASRFSQGVGVWFALSQGEAEHWASAAAVKSFKNNDCGHHDKMRELLTVLGIDAPSLDSCGIICLPVFEAIVMKSSVRGSPT